MKDFFKIFFVLSLIVAAFLYGRDYGEKDFKNSDEFKEFIKSKDEARFAQNELSNIKAKLQNILDSVQIKKNEEILTQLLQVFLADLGLRIENKKLFTDLNCKSTENTPALDKGSENKAVVAATPTLKPPEEKTNNKPSPPRSQRKLKSYEWILQNSTDNSNIVENLKNVEIKDMDQILKNAHPSSLDESAVLIGSYRGRILDINKKEYGTLVFEAKKVEANDEARIKGSLKIFKNEQEEMSRNFSTAQLGFKADEANMIIIENGSRYFQIYKINETQQLAGYFYERLVNGTTKKIGTFILNRVDQF